MVHAGLDLSRRRLDVCLLSERGEVVRELAVSPDGDGLAGLLARTRSVGPVRGVIESMTGARFVHDTLEQLGWDVRIADAHRVKGLAPLACKTECAARRPVVSPAQPGGTRRVVLGSNGLPGSER